MYQGKGKLLFLILVITQIAIAPCLIHAAVVTPKLTITPAMSSIPSDGRPHPAIYVGIDDGKGKPYPLTYSLNVTLSCSDYTALDLPEKVTLTPASYFVIVNASSSAVGTKQVEVTASASGFQSSKTNIAVGPPAGAPTSLEVTVLPNVLLPEAGGQADLLVTLVDGYGNPTPARTNLNIVLFSSDPNIADVASGTVIILEGSTTAKTTLVATGNQGSTTITASTPNLKSDTGILTVTGPQPARIALWSLSKLPANDDSNILFVGITDSSSKPVKLLSPITINLYSSNPTVVSVQTSVTILKGQWMAIVPLNCLMQDGTTTISAASKDLTTATITVGGTVYSSEPVKTIKLYTIADSFPADEASQQALLIQCLDAAGKPTHTDSSMIDLYSSNTDVAEPVPHMWIPSGDSAALVAVTTKLPGSVVITAGSTSYGTTTANLNSYAPQPDKVLIQTPPIPTEGEVEACLVTMKGGTPAPVAQNTLIQLTSSDTQVGSSDVDSVTLSQKTYLKYLKVKGSSPGQFSVTISASGIPSSKIAFTVLDTKPSTFKLYPVKPVVNYEFPILIQMCNAGGSPAVTSDAVKVNLVVSNTSNIQVPSNVIIQGDKTELIFYAKALSTKQTTLTVSSPGFKSSSIQLTPTLAPIQMLLKVSSKMPMNKPTDVQLTVTVDGNPVQGVLVIWNGLGMTYDTSLTDSKGVAINSFTLLQQEEIIEAMVKVGGGYLTASKTITAVPDKYYLNVTSNVPITMDGSGTYYYGDKIYLEAPQTAPMPHILGILGGKYVFNQWIGAVNSLSNAISLTIEGDQSELSAEAMYTSDYTILEIVVGVIAVASVVGFIVYRKYGGKWGNLLKKSKDKKPPDLVKPSPVRR